MNRLQTAVLVATGLAVAPQAFADEVFVGRLIITGASSACATTPQAVVQVGEQSNLVYHPQGPGQVGADSFSIFEDDRAMYIAPNTGSSLDGSGIYKALKIAEGGKFDSYVGGYNIKITQSSPVVVTLTGTFGDYLGNAGCSVGFEAVLGHRPKT